MLVVTYRITDLLLCRHDGLVLWSIKPGVMRCISNNDKNPINQGVAFGTGAFRLDICRLEEVTRMILQQLQLKDPLTLELLPL